MRHTVRSLRRASFAALALAASVLLSPGLAAAVLTNVDSATDICPASADPCVLTQAAQVVDGSVLDFGTRAFEIRTGGTLDISTGAVALRGGRLLLQTSGTAIDMNGPSIFGGSEGGFLEVTMYRKCSGNASIRCLDTTTCTQAGAGTCTVGSGDITVSGNVVGSADFVGGIVARAAGSVSITESIQMNGTAIDSDAGTIDFQAGVNVTMSGRLNADGGPQGTGGDVSLYANQDVIVSGEIDATGGDFDGGIVDLTAGRDVKVSNDILASALTGGGFGGEIVMDGGRDVIVVGGTSGNRLSIFADGHESIDAFGGDGGTHDYFAGRDIEIGQWARLTSEGSPPDGFGDLISLSAGGDVTIDGDFDIRARGSQGGGGELVVDAFGEVAVSSLSQIDVSGGSSGAGDVSLFPDGNLTFAGTIIATAPPTASPGGVDLDTGNDSFLSGTVNLSGGFIRVPGVLGISGCRVQVLPAARFNNTANDGRNSFVIRERLTIQSGAVVSADTSGGSNRVRYRTNLKPPIISGSVTPSPQLTVDATILGCPVCGNGELDGGETCEDGNRINGDGCNSDCQDEGCVAETPGYPSTPLCADTDPCTQDSCNTATHHCRHIASCDDGIACTIDSCAGTACEHTPNDSLCNDGNVCADGFCTVSTGCEYVPVAGACDDGKFCNGSDTCGGGTCSVHTGDPCGGGGECRDACDEIRELCLSPSGTPCAGDGNQCTGDFCNGLGSCIHPQQNIPCDDGLFCNGNDFCNGGACGVHAGNPCTAAGECQDTCDESGDACQSAPGIPCSDDNNFCTDDVCDGSGDCGHPAYDAFTSVAVSVTRKGGPDNDRFSLKATMPISALTVAPNASGVHLAVISPSGAVIFESQLPASGFSDVKGDGSSYRFRDSVGIPEASGVFLAQIKRNPSRGLIYVKMKGREHDVPAIVGLPNASTALGFGSAPGADPCFSAAGMVCEAKGSRVGCVGS